MTNRKFHLTLHLFARCYWVKNEVWQVHIPGMFAGSVLCRLFVDVILKMSEQKTTACCFECKRVKMSHKLNPLHVWILFMLSINPWCKCLYDMCSCFRTCILCICCVIVSIQFAFKLPWWVVQQTTHGSCPQDFFWDFGGFRHQGNYATVIKQKQKQMFELETILQWYHSNSDKQSEPGLQSWGAVASSLLPTPLLMAPLLGLHPFLNSFFLNFKLLLLRSQWHTFRVPDYNLHGWEIQTNKHLAKYSNVLLWEFSWSHLAMMTHTDSKGEN